MLFTINIIIIQQKQAVFHYNQENVNTYKTINLPQMIARKAAFFYDYRVIVYYYNIIYHYRVLKRTSAFFIITKPLNEYEKKKLDTIQAVFSLLPGNNKNIIILFTLIG